MHTRSDRPRCIGIIPARYASSRFPGKPLARILGRPMFWHVYTRARQCPALERVILATDDQRIAQAARSESIPVCMTSPSHPSGSDRVLEAAEQLDIDQEDILVNIQGDEPALEPAMLSVLIKAFTDSRVRVATLVHRISAKEAQDPNVVKAVRTSDNTALYFSRAPVPYSPQKDAEFLGHIGLYAYRLASLRLFNRLCPSDLEKREQLEQLRFLESGVPIQVVETTALSHGVDSPADIRRLEEILREKG